MDQGRMLVININGLYDIQQYRALIENLKSESKEDDTLFPSVMLSASTNPFKNSRGYTVKPDLLQNALSSRPLTAAAAGGGKRRGRRQRMKGGARLTDKIKRFLTSCINASRDNVVVPEPPVDAFYVNAQGEMTEIPNHVEPQTLLNDMPSIQVNVMFKNTDYTLPVLFVNPGEDPEVIIGAEPVQSMDYAYIGTIDKGISFYVPPNQPQQNVLFELDRIANLFNQSPRGNARFRCLIPFNVDSYIDACQYLFVYTVAGIVKARVIDDEVYMATNFLLRTNILSSGSLDIDYPPYYCILFKEELGNGKANDELRVFMNTNQIGEKQVKHKLSFSRERGIKLSYTHSDSQNTKTIFQMDDPTRAIQPITIELIKQSQNNAANAVFNYDFVSKSSELQGGQGDFRLNFLSSTLPAITSARPSTAPVVAPDSWVPVHTRRVVFRRRGRAGRRMGGKSKKAK